MTRFVLITFVSVASALSPIAPSHAQITSIATTDSAEFGRFNGVSLTAVGDILIAADTVAFQQRTAGLWTDDGGFVNPLRRVIAADGNSNTFDGKTIIRFSNPMAVHTGWIAFNAVVESGGSSENAVVVYGPPPANERLVFEHGVFRLSDFDLAIEHDDRIDKISLATGSSSTIATGSRANLGGITDLGDVLWMDDDGLHRNDELLVWDFGSCPNTPDRCTFYSPVRDPAYASNAGMVVFTADRRISEGGSIVTESKGIFAYLESNGGVIDIALVDDPLTGPHANVDYFVTPDGVILIQEVTSHNAWIWRDGNLELFLSKGASVPVPGLESNTVETIDVAASPRGDIAAVLRIRDGTTLRSGLFRADESGDLQTIMLQSDSMRTEAGELFIVDDVIFGNMKLTHGNDGLPGVFSPNPFSENGPLVVIGYLDEPGVPNSTTGHVLVVTGFPRKELKIRVVDADGALIPNAPFEISRVKFDPPRFTETPIGTFVSDDTGVIDLDGTAAKGGDSIRVSRPTYVVKSPKRAHLTIAPRTSNNARVDNAGFDDFDFSMSYDVVNRSVVATEVAMDHTIIGVNLAIGIEWDATQDYVDRLKAGIRSMTNYLYDVTDGQVVIDTVSIVDGGLSNALDIAIDASNETWPNSTGARIFDPGRPLRLPPIRVPSRRAIFRDELLKRPLSPDAQNHYRTLAHELGHYIFDLKDEYKVLVWDRVRMRLVPTADRRRRCAEMQQRSYGFMENQDARWDPAATEMSSPLEYSPIACRNTLQWHFKRNSAWDHVASQYGDSTTLPVTKILTPADRGLVTAYAGPNDALAQNPLDFDAGARVVFINNNTEPAFPEREIVLTSNDVDTLQGISIVQVLSSSNRRVNHGRTGPSGRIFVLGAAEPYSVLAAGVPITAITPGKTHANQASDYAWYSASGVPVGDTLRLSAVDGEFPLTPTLLVNATEVSLGVVGVNPIASPPALAWTKTETGEDGSAAFTGAGPAYEASIPHGDILGTSQLTTSLVDSSGADFFFTTALNVVVYDSASVAPDVGTADGFVEVELDEPMVGPGSAAVFTSPYPPARTGLDDDQLQVTDVSAIAYAGDQSTGEGAITLIYDDARTRIPGAEKDELTIHVHRWTDATEGWVVLSTAVDTAANSAIAVFEGSGTYAAFTTDMSASLGNDDEGNAAGDPQPGEFVLHGAFPNPVGTTSTILVDVPHTSAATIAIFDILGRRIRLLEDGVLTRGRHETVLDASTLSAGVYFVVFEAGDFRSTKSLVVAR